MQSLVYAARSEGRVDCVAFLKQNEVVYSSARLELLLRTLLRNSWIGTEIKLDKSARACVLILTGELPRGLKQIASRESEAAARRARFISRFSFSKPLVSSPIKVAPGVVKLHSLCCFIAQ